jgi:formylmethanofuran dehydrogenase subunit B
MPDLVTCAGCGLLCDDVTLDGDRLSPDCSLGADWFATRRREAAGPLATVDGGVADVDAALARAAELLRGARRPLVHGFAEATVEDARAAVALADRLGALVATGTVTGPWPGVPAVALRGASTATLGEVRDRARVVVIWREDPEVTHPRLLQRLGFDDSAPGERTLVVVDDRGTATAERADVHVPFDRDRDLDALVTLHALHRQVLPSADDGFGGLLSELHEKIAAVPHVAFVYGAGLTGGDGGQRRALALNELVRALAHDRHAVTLPLPDAAGTRGADDVLVWQTGYGGAVDLAGSHPQLVTVTEPLITAEGVDVALRVAGVPVPLPVGVTEIALGATAPGEDLAVAIRTAPAGVAAAGTAHRLDGVPVPLHAVEGSDLPTPAALLTRLLSEVTA